MGSGSACSLEENGQRNSAGWSWSNAPTTGVTGKKLPADEGGINLRKSLDHLEPISIFRHCILPVFAKRKREELKSCG